MGLNCYIDCYINVEYNVNVFVINRNVVGC